MNMTETSSIVLGIKLGAFECCNIWMSEIEIPTRRLLPVGNHNNFIVASLNIIHGSDSAAP